MAAFFNQATTTYFRRAMPPALLAPNGELNYPFYVCCWAKPGVIGVTGTLWSFSNNLTTNQNHFGLIISASSNFTLTRNDPVNGTTNINLTGALTDEWTFLMITAVNNSLIRAASYDVNGNIAQSSSTVLAAPSGMNFLTVGCRTVDSGPAVAVSGAIAELYYGLGNPVGGLSPYGGSNNSPALFRQLARRGPAAVPGMMNSLLEYRSFLKGRHMLNPETDFQSGMVKGVWTVGSTPPVMVPGPPMGDGYERRLGARRFAPY